MVCDTCFWFKMTHKGSGGCGYTTVNQGVCQHAPLSIPVSVTHRCSNWTYNGSPSCAACRYFDEGFCALRVPAKTEYSEQRDPKDWCGQFKGKIKCQK